MSFQTRLLPQNLDLTQLCHTYADNYPYALVSTTNADATNSRFNIFFAYPQETLTLDNNHTLLNKSNLNSNNTSSFLVTLDEWWKTLQIANDDQLKCDLPFTGGWFVFLSYELAVEIEPCLQLPPAQSNIPIAMAVRCPAAIIIDKHNNTVTAIAENEYAHLLDNIEKDCQTLTVENKNNSTTPTLLIKESDSKPYLQQVARIKQYIKDGDIFQANLSRLWIINLKEEVSDVDLFKQLSNSNPGSFAALIKTNNVTILSSSPERLIKSKNNHVETRPIAGTRPRSTTDSVDTELAKELLAHPKEQAEHIMLIDLERNDLGRICIPGSVKVKELMSLETYQHVHHIVSNVEGEIRKGITPVDIIKAVFPGGTITGCPKVHCMEILAEMEKEPRGAYTGSAGYINRDGSMDFNILIRTMVREGDNIAFRAGGGIVADSDPQYELEETRAKAKGLLKIFATQKKTCNA